MNPDSGVSNWWTDKALWMALFAMILPPLSKKLDVPMDPTQLATMAVIVGSYVAAHKWKSSRIAVANIQAQSNAGPAAPAVGFVASQADSR